MKARNIIATLLLMVAGLQTAKAQKIILHMPDNQKVEYEISQLDSITFVEAESLPVYLTCPDEHHPHAIDLGLPSGTKWCCCNVGASTPEGYGGYFAWGETNEKSNYSLETYAYTNVNDEGSKYITNIGFNIANTSYDVAHIRMGGLWRMPSVEQQIELLNNSSQLWTKQNDVEGMLLTGSNGGQIFLPAAGHRILNDLYIHDDISYSSFYWSGSLDPETFKLYGYAYVCTMEIGFSYNNWVMGIAGAFYRCYGLPVRAVYP